MFRDILTAMFGELHFGQYARYKYIKEYITEKGIISNDKHLVVLDAGCGSGKFTLYFAKKYKQLEIIGLDIQKELIITCNRDASMSELKNIKFNQEDLKKIRYHEKFGFIICIDVLEHIREDKMVLANFYNALIPGGKVLLHTPQKGKYLSPKFGFRIFVKNNMQNNKTLNHKISHVRIGYTKEELVSIAGRVGFSILDTRNTFGFFAMLAHTLFELVRPHSKIFWLIIKPVLTLFLLVDTVSGKRDGGGLLLLLEK